MALVLALLFQISEEPRGARESQESKDKPGGASQNNQEQHEGARTCREEPKGVCRDEEKPGGTRDNRPNLTNRTGKKLLRGFLVGLKGTQGKVQ